MGSRALLACSPLSACQYLINHVSAERADRKRKQGAFRKKPGRSFDPAIFILWRARPDLHWHITVLQTVALLFRHAPLGPHARIFPGYGERTVLSSPPIVPCSSRYCRRTALRRSGSADRGGMNLGGSGECCPPITRFMPSGLFSKQLRPPDYPRRFQALGRHQVLSKNRHLSESPEKDFEEFFHVSGIADVDLEDPTSLFLFNATVVIGVRLLWNGFG